MRKTQTAPAPIPTLRGYNPRAFVGTPADMSDWYGDGEDPNAVPAQTAPVNPSGGVPSPFRQTIGMGQNYAGGFGQADPRLHDYVNQRLALQQTDPYHGYNDPGPYPGFKLEDPTAAITASPGNRPQMGQVDPYQRNYGLEATKNARGMAVGTLLAGLLGGTGAALATGTGLNQGFQQGANAVDAERARRYELAKEAAGRELWNQQQAYQDALDAKNAQVAAVAARNQNAGQLYGANVGAYGAAERQAAAKTNQGNLNAGEVPGLLSAEGADTRANSYLGIAQSGNVRAENAQKFGQAQAIPGLMAGIAPYSGTPYGTNITNSTNAALVANGMMPIPLPGGKVGLMPMNFEQAGQDAARQSSEANADYTRSKTTENPLDSAAQRGRITAENTEGAARTQIEKDRLAESKRQFDVANETKLKGIAARDATKGGKLDPNNPASIRNFIGRTRATITNLYTHRNQALKSKDSAGLAGIDEQIAEAENDIQDAQTRLGILSGKPATEPYVPAPMNTEGYTPGMGGSGIPAITGQPETPIGVLNPTAPAPIKQGTPLKTPKGKPPAFKKPIMGKSGGSLVPSP